MIFNKTATSLGPHNVPLNPLEHVKSIQKSGAPISGVGIAFACFGATNVKSPKKDRTNIDFLTKFFIFVVFLLFWSIFVFVVFGTKKNFHTIETILSSYNWLFIHQDSAQAKLPDFVYSIGDKIRKRSFISSCFFWRSGKSVQHNLKRTQCIKQFEVWCFCHFAIVNKDEFRKRQRELMNKLRKLYSILVFSYLYLARVFSPL